MLESVWGQIFVVMESIMPGAHMPGFGPWLLCLLPYGRLGQIPEALGTSIFWLTAVRPS